MSRSKQLLDSTEARLARLREQWKYNTAWIRHWIRRNKENAHPDRKMRTSMVRMWRKNLERSNWHILKQIRQCKADLIVYKHELKQETANS